MLLLNLIQFESHRFNFILELVEHGEIFCQFIDFFLWLNELISQISLKFAPALDLCGLLFYQYFHLMHLLDIDSWLHLIFLEFSFIHTRNSLDGGSAWAELLLI